MIQHQEKYVAYIKANGVGSNDKVADSCKSYISYLNSIQKHLGISISASTLSMEVDILNISEKLKKQTTLSDKTIKNYGSAMKQYVSLVASL
jgi:hypothetical protein